MAYGFGSTLGSGTTDKVVSGYTTEHALTTYYVNYNRNGVGGGGFGRIINKHAGHNLRWAATATSKIAFSRGDNLGVAGVFHWPDGDDTGVWHRLVLSMDTGSTSNVPVVHVDGTAQTVTTLSPPTVFETTADAYEIGNRASDNARVWDGILAEVAIWSVILSASEKAALAQGISPFLVQPANLVEYIPMVRSGYSFVRPAPTTTGTAVQTHPVVIRPRRKQIQKLITAIASPPTSRRFLTLLNAA